VWPNGVVSVLIDGRVDSSPQALHNLAGRILAGAPAAERGGSLTYEEQRELKSAKIIRDGADYVL
jgi:hypothetical protein